MMLMEYHVVFTCIVYLHVSLEVMRNEPWLKNTISESNMIMEILYNTVKYRYNAV